MPPPGCSRCTQSNFKESMAFTPRAVSATYRSPAQCSLPYGFVVDALQNDASFRGHLEEAAAIVRSANLITVTPSLTLSPGAARSDQGPASSLALDSFCHPYPANQQGSQQQSGP